MRRQTNRRIRGDLAPGERLAMTDTLDMKTTKSPLVWTHDDDDLEALAEDIVSTIQRAQRVIILVEDGSLIIGNAIDGFDHLENHQIPEHMLTGIAYMHGFRRD
jgi:hypothetical protein